MKFFKKAMALFLSAGMIFGASAPAMAAEGALTPGSGVYALFSNVKELCVSIDTKEGNAKSEWFGIGVDKDSPLVLKVGTAPTIKTVLKDMGENKTEKDTALAATLSMAPINGPDSREWGTRFLVNTGKTPPAGIYYVTLDIPMTRKDMDPNVPIVYGQASVELHVNSGDPSYVKGNEIRFDMEFNGQAQTLISQPVQFINPSSTSLSGVQGSFYFDWECTEKLDQLSVIDATSNSFKVKVVPENGVLAVPYHVYFKMQTKTRAVFTPVQMTTGVYATNPESVLTLVYDKNLDLSSDEEDRTDVMAKDSLGNIGPVQRVTLLQNTFDNKEAMEVVEVEETGDNGKTIEKKRIVAYEKASGKFKAEYSNGIKSDAYVIDNAVLVFKDNPISSADTYVSDEEYALIVAGGDIDLNNLDTYTVPMQAYGYDVNSNMVTPKTVSLSTSNANNLFEIVDGSIKANESKKCLEFSLKLKNEDTTIHDLFQWVFLDVTVENTVVKGYGRATMAAQPTFYLSEAGSTASLSDKSVSMSLGRIKKFDLHVKGYKTGDQVSNQLSVQITGMNSGLHNEAFSIVRGRVLFVPASGEMVETITVRYNTPPGVGNNYLLASGDFVPEITNQDVLLKLSPSITGEINSMVQLQPSSSSTGGGSGGGGGTGGPATSRNQGLVNGSGNKGSASVTTTQATSATNKAVAAAKASSSKTANVQFTNVTSISPASISAIVSAAKKAGVEAVITADTKVGGAIVARISMNPADLAAVKADVKLGVTIGNQAIANTFGKYFTNQVQVVSFAQKGAFGTTVNVAVKVDLTKLNVETLKFYSYDAATNTYTENKTPAYFVDTKGYLHFSTTVGNNVIITDKPLTSK